MDPDDRPEEDDDADDIDPSDFEGDANLATLGKMGLGVYRAVLRDGGSWNEAFAVTGAFFAGSMKATFED